MKHSVLPLLLAMSCLVSGCGDTSPGAAATNQPTGNQPNPNNGNPPVMPTPPVTPTMCAEYEVPGAAGEEPTTMTGVLAGVHCTYGNDFVDADSPLLTDLTLAKLPAGGAHIFTGLLAVGLDRPTSELAAATPAITAGGDGPTLTIEAGATLAFTANSGGININRGSRIMAAGTALAPITFTSDEDLAAGGSAVAGQWNGIAIAGFGVINSCAYTAPGAPDILRTFAADDDYKVADDSPELTLVNPCDPQAFRLSGATLYHGGTSSGDNSGVLTYAIIKYAGFDRAALTMRAVGSGTMVNNVQVFSVLSIGLSVHGGAFDVTNLMIYNVENGVIVNRGFVGKLERVLISQVDDEGDLCISIRGENAGSLASATGLVTKILLNHLTCDFSPSRYIDEGINSRGGGSGITVSRGGDVRIQNSLIVISKTRPSARQFEPDDNNFCLGESSVPRSEALTTNLARIHSVATVFSCYEIDSTISTAWTHTQERSHFVLPGDPTSNTDSALRILSTAGTVDNRPIFSLLQSASVITALDGSTVARPEYAPEGSGITFLGAISTGDNPFAGWVFGVFP